MATDIDFPASRQHFAAHLAPVAAELGRRGYNAYCWVPDTPGSHPIDGLLDPSAVGRVTVVSASADMIAAAKLGRRVVLMEHGAGQSYSNRDASYVGGAYRNKADLVLLPNEMAAERHRKFWPEVPCEVVGCPLVDDLLRLVHTPTHPPTVAVTWHWDATKVSPEARSAWPFIGSKVLDVLTMMRGEGTIDLLGTAHPRIIDKIRPEYEARGIPVAEGHEVFASASVLVADNTSSMYEFAALGRPVVVLDAPVYRTHRHHGLRFWSEVDIGPRVGRRGGPLAYRTAVEYALDPDAEQIERREEVMERVFPHRGTATQRAVDAILTRFRI